MHVIGLDHLVVNTHNLEQALHFYRDVLGLEILRLEEFRAGKVGFVSARISPETIIDIRPTLLLDSGVLGFHAVHKSPRIYKVLEKEGL